MDDLSFPTTEVAAEIHTLLSMHNDAGRDAELSNFIPQYEAACHMWMAFHAHRDSKRHGGTSVGILQQATLAIKVLHRIFPTTPQSLPCTSPKCPPKVRVTQGPKGATRSSPRKKTTVAKASPKPRKSRCFFFLNRLMLMLGSRTHTDTPKSSAARTIAHVNIRKRFCVRKRCSICKHSWYVKDGHTINKRMNCHFRNAESTAGTAWTYSFENPAAEHTSEDR
jgi:hypothetical protein